MFGCFSKEKNQNWRTELKTQGKNSKLKEKTQNSRKKLSFPAFPKTMNGRIVHKQKAWFTWWEIWTFHEDRLAFFPCVLWFVPLPCPMRRIWPWRLQGWPPSPSSWTPHPASPCNDHESESRRSSQTRRRSTEECEKMLSNHKSRFHKLPAARG